MARQRNIAPGFFRNEDLGECSPLARLLFAGLWCWADREGLVEDRPRRLRAEILPYDQVDGEALVAELLQRGFLARYEVDGVKVLRVVAFGEYQDPHPNEAKSTLPKNTEDVPSVNDGSPLVHQRCTKGPPMEDQGPTKVDTLHARPSRPSRPSSPSSSSSLPTKAQLQRQQAPLAQQVIEKLDALGWRLTHAGVERRASLEESIGLLGVDAVAEDIARDLEAKQTAGERRPTSIGWYQPDLAAAAKRPRTGQVVTTSTEPEVDLSWFSQLPTERRALAEAAWAARCREVQSEFKPDAVPRVLAMSAEVMRQEFLQ